MSLQQKMALNRGRFDNLGDDVVMMDVYESSQDHRRPENLLNTPPPTPPTRPWRKERIWESEESGETWHYLFSENEQPPVRRVETAWESKQNMADPNHERSGLNSKVYLRCLNNIKCARSLPKKSIHNGVRCVAIKKLAVPLDFVQARRAAALASADWHAHVVPLLFSYSYLTEFYLVFPQAKSNLEEYWENNKLYLVENRATMDYPLVLWVTQQCEGLADALLHLHDLCLTSAEDRSKLLVADNNVLPKQDLVVGTHHGNIKPTNILAFFRPGRQFPILQLTDFGCTTYTTRRDHETIPRTRDRYTGDYVAPEVFFSRAVSTKSDIWSLGCVFLDFVEWLTPIHSSKRVPRRILTEDDQAQLCVQGREAWRDWRRSPVPNGPMDVAAFYFDPSSEGLSDWIDTYFNDAKYENSLCSAWMAEFLQLLEDDMLQSLAEARKTSRMIRMKLQKMRRKCERAPGGCEYATQPIIGI